MKLKQLLNLETVDFLKGNGLAPVVVQHHRTLQVLTLAYIDREALEMTIETGFAHYFRRSHGKVMKKGETSGNFQEVKEILVDCDQDSILMLVDPKGPACHLGEESCFHTRLAKKD